MAQAPKLFRFDSRALAKVAQATSSVIAWLLIVPDAIALLPVTDSVIAWFLKLLGLWISVAVLWFVSFLAILHVVRIISKGIYVGEDGITLGRFAKLIPWDRIDAIEIEPQELFSKLFSLHTVAKRLTLFEVPWHRHKLLAARLITHNIPSFLFATADFDELVESAMNHKFAFVPQAQNALLLEPKSFRKLRLTHKLMMAQRVLVTLVIAFGLVTVLGRKAIVNYSYNYGNKCMAQHDFNEARKRYARALVFEPTFAAAWNNLAIADFYLGDLGQAKKHWQKAVVFKPDYVEPKISLAHLCLHQRDFSTAKELIGSAVNLSPLNSAARSGAILKRADYNMRMGHFREAMSDARAVLAEPPDRPGRYMATCLIAQAKLQLGDAKAALKVLSSLGPPNPVYSGENVAFRLDVESQCREALGEPALAEKLAREAVQLAPTEAEISVNLAEILIASQKNEEAKNFIQKAIRLSPDDPYCYLAGAKLALKESQQARAQELLSQAVSIHSQDAQSLAKAAQIALALGNKEQALQLARSALTQEPLTSQAAEVVNELGQTQNNLTN